MYLAFGFKCNGWVETEWANQHLRLWSQPSSCRDTFLLSGVYYRCHRNMCASIRDHKTRLHVSEYSISAPTWLRLNSNAENSTELDYTEKHKDIWYKEETSSCFMGIKELCMSMYVCLTASKNTARTNKRPSTVEASLSVVWWHNFISTYFPLVSLQPDLPSQVYHYCKTEIHMCNEQIKHAKRKHHLLECCRGSSSLYFHSSEDQSWFRAEEHFRAHRPN